MEIDQKIIAKTVRCEKNFACLTNPNHVLCKINYNVNALVYFIDSIDRLPCPYKNSFGFTSFCTCPVRIEIFKKYRK